MAISGRKVVRSPLASRPILVIPETAPSQSEESVSSTAQTLLNQAKNALQTGSASIDRIKESLEAISSSLELVLKGDFATRQGSRFTLPPSRKEAIIDSLFSQVKKAVFLADAQIEKYCFKRRGSYTQAECKKGVTTSLEKMANEIWKSVADAMDKPASQHLTEAGKALSALSAELEDLGKSQAESLAKIEEVLYEHVGEEGAVQGSRADTARREPLADSGLSEALTARGGRSEFTNELQAEGQRMLNSFQRFTSSGKQSGKNYAGLRGEMDGILKEMVSAVQNSTPRAGRSEDADTWRMKKEVLRIRQRVDGLCRHMDDSDTASVVSLPVRARDLSMVMDNTDAISEVSDRSRARSVAITSGFDPEELKQLLQRQMQATQKHMLGAISQQTQGISVVSQTQAAMQSKQDALSTEVSEIRKKLEELFPSNRAKPKLGDLSKSISLLKAFAPEIRALTDQEFIEKFTRQITVERQELDSFMTTVRAEGYSFVSLEDVAKEFARLKDSYTSLREDHDDYLLKMIRAQSEYEIEVEYHKSLIGQLQSELQQLKDSYREEELSSLRDKVAYLTEENVKLRTDLLDMSVTVVEEQRITSADPISLKPMDHFTQTEPDFSTRSHSSSVSGGSRVSHIASLVSQSVGKRGSLAIVRVKGVTVHPQKVLRKAVTMSADLTQYPLIEPYRQDSSFSPFQPIISQEESFAGFSETEESESEEVAELQQRIHAKVEVLSSLSAQEQAIEGKLATLAAFPDLEAMRKHSDALSEVHKKYDATFGEIEGFQKQISALKRKKSGMDPRLSLAPASKSLLDEVQATLRLEEAFEICGTVAFSTHEWALVHMNDAFVWTKTGLGRTQVAREEMIEQFAEASAMLTPFTQLPKQLVLATSQLLAVFKTSLRKK